MTWLMAAVYASLLVFGMLYNGLVAWLERKGYTEGYLSLIVAIGVAATVGGVAVIDWRAALITLGGFIASGLPMIVGSIVRYVQKREALLQALRKEATNGNATETLAE